MPHLTRRGFLRAAGLAPLGMISPAPAAAAAAPRAAGLALYVGTYTNGRSRGIYRCRLDADTGALAVEGVAARGVANPSFLVVDRGQRFLYAVSETAEFEGEPGGGVAAFAIDRRTGDLRALNRQPSRGAAPCHLAVDRGNRFLLVANYSGGNVTVLPIRPDGSLGPPSMQVRHSGSGPNARRQAGPHAHSVTFDPTNRFVYAADLGIDRVMIYRFDAGELAPADPPWVQARPGAGPRHFAFHPDARRAYVINELDSTVSTLAFDPATGAMREVHTVSTLPAGWTGENSCADVHVSADGRFVYGSNRGHDSVAVFAVDPEGGALAPVQHQPTLGRTPRNFALDPTGRWLLAANQGSDSVAVFAVDPETGRLSPTGQVAEVPVPVCLRFVLPHP